MRFARRTASTLFTAALCLPLSARAQPPATVPAIAVAVEGRSAEERLRAFVFPEVIVDSWTISTFLDFAEKNVPGFQAVLVNRWGDDNYPMLPNMKLKNVTLGQMMELIQKAAQSVPGQDMVFSTIAGENGTVVFTVHYITPPKSTPVSVMKVYRLSEAIDAQTAKKLAGADAQDPAKKAEARKAALNDILSLVSSSLGEMGTNLSTQVHEETQTLIVHGTAEQLDAISKVLAVVTPIGNGAGKQDEDPITRLSEVDRLRAANEDLSARLAKTQQELARLNAAQQSAKK